MHLTFDYYLYIKCHEIPSVNVSEAHFFPLEEPENLWPWTNPWKNHTNNQTQSIYTTVNHYNEGIFSMQSDRALKNSHPSALPEEVQDPVPDQCSPHIYIIVANINALLIFRRLPLIDLQAFNYIRFVWENRVITSRDWMPRQER